MGDNVIKPPCWECLGNGRSLRVVLGCGAWIVLCSMLGVLRQLPPLPSQRSTMAPTATDRRCLPSRALAPRACER